MDKSETIFSKMKEVFKLISFARLREDIDDTLFQKLLTFIKNESTKSGDFMSEMIRETDLRIFIIETLSKQPEDINSEAVSFFLQLLTEFNNHADILLLLEENESQGLLLILNIFQPKNLELISFSVKVAILKFLTGFIANEERLLWIFNNNGTIDASLHCLTEESLYVQKAAVNFTSLCMSTSLHMSKVESINMNHYSLVFKKLCSHLMDRLTQINNPSFIGKSRKSITSSVDVLKSFLEISSHNIEVLPIKKILDIINDHLKSCYIDEVCLNKVFDLLAFLISPREQDLIILEELIKKLIDQKQYTVLMNFLSSSVVRHQSEESLITTEMLNIFMAPSCYITDTESVPSNLKNCLQSILINKTSLVNLINQSITCLFNIKKNLTDEQRQNVLIQLKKILFVIIQPSAESVHQAYICNCHKIQVAVLTFLMNYPEIYESQHTKHSDVFNLMDVLIKTIENPNTNILVIDKCAKILVQILNVWGKVCTETNKQWHTLHHLTSFGEILQKRLLDPEREIMDSILYLIDSIFSSHKDVVSWLCSFQIHTIVWDMASADCYDAYIKAAILQTLSNFILSSVGWEFLKKDRNLKTEDAVLLFCKALLCDSDTFVHRAAVKIISNWIQQKDTPLYFYKALCLAATSDLDWEVKISALESWQWIAKQQLSQKSNNAQELENLCQYGFGHSLISALEDHDQSVQNTAATILLNLSNHLNHLKSEVPHSDSPLNNTTKVVNDNKQNIITSDKNLNSKNKSEIIESVLNIETNEQLCHLITPKMAISIETVLQQKDVRMDSKCFLQFLWSKDLNKIVEESGKSTDLYSSNYESLLDDIINCSIQLVTRHPTMDCY